jgi:hypothetical protein
MNRNSTVKNLVIWKQTEKARTSIFQGKHMVFKEIKISLKTYQSEGIICHLTGTSPKPVLPR